MAMTTERNYSNDQSPDGESQSRRARNERNNLVLTRRSQEHDRKTSIGNVIPSDHAFVDIILDKRELTSSCSSLFAIRSIRQSHLSGNVLCITFTHELSYRGELIFSVETTTNCDGTEIRGQSSICVLVNGQLKVKISTKAKSAVSAGAGRNSRETKVYSLVELVKLASEARQNEMKQEHS
jgi:hypothetical protein